MNKMRVILLCSIISIVVLVIIAVFVFSSTSDTVFIDLPENADPYVIGKKIAERYVSESFRNFDGIDSQPFEVTYSEVCTWLGALKFANKTKDTELFQKLEERFFPLLGKKKQLMPKADNVDHTVFGAVPLQLYLQNGNDCFYHIGIDYADRQWEISQNIDIKANTRDYVDLGLSWQTRFWIDDMFMISIIQSRAYLASGNEKYINRAAYQMSFYLDSIQQPGGLFFHAGNAPFFWCRGNGWMAAGMTELLKVLPERNVHYQRIYDAYLMMMDKLKNMCNEEGLWNQLIDEKNAWTETSGSAMITYAFISGINEGWLDRAIYEPVARKAWMSLVSYINDNGDLREVCQGTNIGSSSQYYLDRNRIVGDLHGQAPILWCATALIEK